ncbi:PQQ-binding-like beta-propeller repeat protein [Planctomicrobium sp. SH668]|uniref:outer membrane protein assembly factor BamB family protein n=1 Tax=Planctomicrobium sp. SH668 TaxID=3448126 RepID=UPI003F5C6A52
MPFLEIVTSNGERERCELKKQSPVAIGRHASNDIQIDEPEVAILHCRISWSNGGFEAVSATQEPLDINGTLKGKSILSPGDLLRFGTVDIYFRDESSQATAASSSRRVAEILELPPVASTPAPVETKVPSPVPVPPRIAPRQKPVPVEEVVVSPQEIVVPLEQSQHIRDRLRSNQSRPGEEDLLQSPLILSLVIGACLLLLAGGIFYFIALRQTSQQAFEQARKHFDDGNYRGSIEALERYLIDYPGQSSADDARRLLGQAKVRQLIEGGAPNYAEGLKQLQLFIEDERDRGQFESLFAELMDMSKTIALGAGIAAGKQLDPQQLDVSKQAVVVLKTYSPKDVPPTETFSQIDQVQRASQRQILQDNVYREELLRIDQAIRENQPLAALQIRRSLLNRYPVFEVDQKLTDRLKTSLEQELLKSNSASLERPAVQSDHNWVDGVLTLCFQTRTKTDEVPAGQTIPVLAQDCCYGIDLVTGEPVWRRVIGFQSHPFQLSEVGSPGVVLFDANHLEVVRLNRSNGSLVWRQSTGSALGGVPLLHENALYVPTADHRLLCLDLETGTLRDSLNFSQPVGTPVVSGDGSRIIVPGHEEVLYVVDKNTFQLSGVFDLGHSAGALAAPMLSVSNYLIVAVNGQGTASVKLLVTKNGAGSYQLTAAQTVEGIVVDPPVLRGRDLFVPSLGNRVTSFTISDDPDQPPLTVGPVYVGESKLVGSAYLLPGPDRQLWVATDSLNRLRLTAESLQLDGPVTGAGITSQPLSFLNGSLYHARRRPFAEAVTLTRTDREEMKSDWQAVVGAKLIAISGGADAGKSVVAVNDMGQVFQVTLDEIASKTFHSVPVTRLPVPVDLTTPLLAADLRTGHVAVAAGGSAPRLWILNSKGQVERNLQLSKPFQALPVDFGDSVLLPLASEIQIVSTPESAAIQPFRLPTGETLKWSSVIALGQNRAAAATDTGRLYLLELNQDPVPYLGEVQRVDLGAEIEIPIVGSQLWIVVADRSNRVSLFASERLEKLGERQFEKPVTSPMQLLDEQLYVEIGSDELHCLQASAELKTLWQIPIDKSSVVGVVLLDSRLVVALQNGNVWFVDPQDGTKIREFDVQCEIALGPFVVDQNVVVGTADGSLIIVPQE